MKFCSAVDGARKLAEMWKIPLPNIADEAVVERIDLLLGSIREDLADLLANLPFAMGVFEKQLGERQAGRAIAHSLKSLMRAHPELTVVAKLFSFGKEQDLRDALEVFLFSDEEVGSLVAIQQKFSGLRIPVRYAQFLDTFGDGPIIDDYDVDLLVAAHSLKLRVRQFDPEGETIFSHIDSAPSVIELYANMLVSIMREVDRVVLNGRLQLSDPILEDIRESLRYARDSISKPVQFMVESQKNDEDGAKEPTDPQ